MTTIPSMSMELSMTRIAATAAPSAPFLSPRPIHRPAASAAASVTRTSSIARLRSGACASPFMSVLPLSAAGSVPNARRANPGARVRSRADWGVAARGASLVTEYAWTGPRRGADRAVLLAHGAGADFSAPVLVATSAALAETGVPSLRFQYPYRSAGRRAPDRPSVLEAATREAAAELARRS